MLRKEVFKMKVVIGLGNPGKKYDQTRHNIGFAALDACAKEFSMTIDQRKHQGVYGEYRFNGERIYFLKPLTYMNLSGESVRPFLDFYNIQLEDIVVIYDDLDLPVGTMRLRQQGSAGGHNGIKSLIAHLGTEKFKRIRLGVGRPEQGESVANYVLSCFRKGETAQVTDVLQKTVAAVNMWLEKPFLDVMNKFN